MAARASLGMDMPRLNEFRSALREVDSRWPKELRLANNRAAEVVAGRARSIATGGTRQQAAAAPTIRALSDQLRAKIVVGNSRRAPFATGAFMGARGRFGWFADPKYAAIKKRQFPAWVGNQWDPGDSLDGHASGEPYVFGDALRAVRAEFMDTYMRSIDDVYQRAFPQPGGTKSA